VGTPLLGLQVYDNRRAIDYLASRPDVDPARLAITGASGGGNQTLYAGATDERLTAVVPVCGIGTYESYLTTACCVCELNVGGLTYATTGDLLAMIAPRALLVVSATRDALQFSVGEAAKSIAYAQERFRLMGQADKIRHLAIDSGHDYNRPMREAMYGWLGRWLKDEGDGRPVSEPEVKTEDPQSLRCYPQGVARPRSVITIPEFARREGLARLASLPPVPDHRERWNADAARMKSVLQDKILGGFPRPVPPEIKTTRVDQTTRINVEMTPEPGLRLGGVLQLAGPRQNRNSSSSSPGTLIVIDSDMMPTGESSPRVAAWVKAGYACATLGLRATGRLKPETQVVAGVADHNEAEWGIWLNRPLLGQWVWDTLRWIDVLGSLPHAPRGFSPGQALPAPWILFGQGPMSLVAVLAAAFDPRITSVLAERCLVSLVASSSKPWSNIPMGLIAPNILDVGDTGHLAALVAPRKLVIGSGLETDGVLADSTRLSQAFAFTRTVYSLLGTPNALKLGASIDPPLGP
jgi:hypothetical protein